MANRCISINEKDEQIIKTHCKQTGRKFSTYLVSSAIESIKREIPNTKNPKNLWDLFGLGKNE
jgi:hypothetical protein